MQDYSSVIAVESILQTK